MLAREGSPGQGLLLPARGPIHDPMALETELRDRLAVDRTQLANERTLLAYARTSLTIAGAGFGLHLFETGALLVPLSLFGVAAVLLLLGVYRFLRVASRLRKPLARVEPS